MWDKGHAVISAAESHTKGRWQENPVWLALGDKVRPDGHLYLKGAEQRTTVDNGRLSGSGLFCNFFFPSTPLQNKARLVSTEHSYSNWKNLCLNEAVGKINCKNSSSLSSRRQKDLCYSKSL